MEGQQSDRPLVSIGIPAFNTEAYIAATLNSVEQQTYPNIEIIIVDDGSTDSTLAIIKDWAKRSKRRPVIIQNPRNFGLTKTCNILLQHVNGKYFQKLDSDDLILPEKIERQVNIFETQPEDIALVYSAVYLVDEQGKQMEEDYYSRIGYQPKAITSYYKQLLQINFIPNPAVLLRTRVAREVNGYDETLLYEDWDMWLKIAARYQFFFDTRKTSCYRIRKSSMMMDPANKIKINNTLFTIFQNNIAINRDCDTLVWEKLKQVVIYSFFLGDEGAGKKMKWYLSKKNDLKVSGYFLLQKLGLQHPSYYFSKIRK